MNTPPETFDRPGENLGNIVHLEHVNLDMPDQRLATAFHVTGLGLTRDPFLRTGLDNMWINVGRSQVHMPSRRAVPQRLRGTIGLVLPDLDAVEAALGSVASLLRESPFAVRREADGSLAVTCPFGNHYRCHAADGAPNEADAAMQLGMPYVELNVPPGTAARIAAFYQAMLGAPASLGERRGAPTASVAAGRGQHLHFRETADPQPAFDGHHVAIYLADFGSPHARLRDRRLITIETDRHEWRFQDIVDLDTGAVLFTLEHEVRSMTHPLHGRALVNRDAAQDRRRIYRPGHDAFRGAT